jgi:OOP family OmpA-OmpF porin
MDVAYWHKIGNSVSHRTKINTEKQPLNCAGVVLLLISTALGAQNLEHELFDKVDQLRASAEDAHCALLAPQSYSRGVKAYERARKDFENSKNLKKIKARIEESEQYFDKALENSKLAKLTLHDAIESRTDANEAEAYRLASQDWSNGEKQFNKATLTLEKGDLKRAQTQGNEADDTFRLAELNAIKARYLSEARHQIAEATQAKVDRYAPNTFGRAKTLLADAEAVLDGQRYEPEQAISYGAQASYEARHAMYIAAIGRRVDDEDITVEELILDWESPLESAAEAAGIEADFSAGLEATSAALSSEIGALKHSSDTLAEEIRERDQLILGLEDELHDLDTRLGGASAERAALMRSLQNQARAREQIIQIERLFNPQEAFILRDGDKLIIRLTGLGFGSGSANIEANAVGLMDKVQRAVSVFPRCELIVEGHTDAYGGAEQNLALSRDRAQAVVDYMITNMNIAAFRIKAIGFGDTLPIASNKTIEGRAKNRRIDLIIIPEGE